MKFYTYSMALLIVATPISAMQRAAVVYDPEKTNRLKSLLNLYGPEQCPPEKEIISLVSGGADPNVKADCGFGNKYDWLHILISIPCASGQVENLISFLLHNGADLNRANSDSYLLINACNKGNYACIAMLIAAGVNVRVRNPYGNSALLVALGDPKFPYLYRNAIVKLLLEKGAAADINVTNNRGESPYNFAKKNGLWDILELFEKYKSKTS